MSENVNKYYKLIIYNLNDLNNKIKQNIESIFAITDALISLNIVIFPDEMMTLYSNLKSQYSFLNSPRLLKAQNINSLDLGLREILFQKNNSKNLLKLVVKENLMMNLRDNLYDFQTNMLLYAYAHDNTIENCLKILSTTTPLINKSISLFIDESNAYKLLMDSINVAKIFCFKKDKHEKSILISSLHIVNSIYN